MRPPAALHLRIGARFQCMVYATYESSCHPHPTSGGFHHLLMKVASNESLMLMVVTGGVKHFTIRVHYLWDRVGRTYSYSYIPTTGVSFSLIWLEPDIGQHCR